MPQEYRCPDCGSYCKANPINGEAYCVSDGWFHTDNSPHTVTV